MNRKTYWGGMSHV